ncbi:MAG: hypothetical protein ACXQT6_00315 [Candidatus Methanospirareceae archaeon]
MPSYKAFGFVTRKKFYIHLPHNLESAGVEGEAPPSAVVVRRRPRRRPPS